jgi:hypothetical protein
MTKFLVLYRAPHASFEKMMKNSTPEQRKAGFDAWMAWTHKAGAALVDMGAPLGPSFQVTAAGPADSTNDLGGYSILQAESKDALAKLCEGHPHFHMEGGFIEIIQIMPMPGA